MKYFYFVLAGLCTLLGTVCSCSTEEAATQILGSGSETPVFIAYKVVSEGEIDFEFSQPVRVLSINFDPPLENVETEDGKTIRVSFSGGPNPGEQITADLLVEDEQKNTFSVLVPLRIKNSRIPKLQINELRTEYSNPKAEFIEFKTVTAGNLGALRVFITGNTKSPLVYEFPPVETSAGEYIVLHLRKIETEEDARDELGGSLNESGGTDSSPDARDIWIAGTDKLLHKTDAVYVLDQDDTVIDAVMLAETSGPSWSKDYFAEAAEMLFGNNKAWKSADGGICSPAQAVPSGSTTNTRTICRDETVPDTNTAADWYITKNSGATPGKPNNTARYNN